MRHRGEICCCPCLPSLLAHPTWRFSLVLVGMGLADVHPSLLSGTPFALGGRPVLRCLVHSLPPPCGGTPFVGGGMGVWQRAPTEFGVQWGHDPAELCTGARR